MIPTILVLPGLGNSGPGHWQTVWETQSPGCVRVEQRDWDRPELSAWLAALEEALEAAGNPVVLVAHSLSCSLVAHFAVRYPEQRRRIRAALLVAPADVDSPDHTPPETRGFAPIPLARLPFPSIVVASRNDPYVEFSRAEALALAWGSELVDAGNAGHLNAESQLGAWEPGRRCLERLIAASAR